MLSHIYKKEMIDALRDRKTILLTILVPMIMMLGLVFFYESMLSDKGEQYTLAVGHQQKEAAEEKGASAIMLSAILPMLILTSIVSGAMPIALDIMAGEKDRKSIEALLLTPVSRNKVLVGKWLAVSTFGVASGVLALVFLILSTVLFTENLKTAFQLGDHMWSVIGASALIIVLSALLISAMELFISIISSSVKEAQSYMSFIVFLPMLPMFFILSKAPNQFDLSYFLIPFLNLHALFKQLLFGMVEPAAILYTSGTIAVLIAIFFLLARACFLKDKWVLPK
ncbi:protein natB [Bacillus spizizenii]|uniref:ABC transporter permease n=1 Tax=Bacillus spizizenii TaxID=96241 RepID=UPI000B52E5D5|nr:ABC transporter permease [Bacillus spizizenii]OWV35252.1 protein natB [Bacillus spizizenii]